MLFLSKSEKETQKIAGDLAHKIIGSKAPVVIALEGELGAGKTTFVQGFAKILGVKVKVKSPTFVLMKKYPFFTISRKLKTKNYLYHLDCYRARDHRDLLTLDLRSLFKSSNNIVLIEWPERVVKILPKKLIRVHIDHIDTNKRKIMIKNV